MLSTFPDMSGVRDRVKDADQCRFVRVVLRAKILQRVCVLFPNTSYRKYVE